MVPAKLEVPNIVTEAWDLNKEFFTLCQFYPNNPFWVVKPRIQLGGQFDIGSPTELAKFIDNEAILEKARVWLDRQGNNPLRGELAFIYNKETRYSDEMMLHRSGPLNHIFNLESSIIWPTKIGLVFPEGLKPLLNRTKRIWVPARLDIEPLLKRDWKLTDRNTFLEYSRIR